MVRKMRRMSVPANATLIAAALAALMAGVGRPAAQCTPSAATMRFNIDDTAEVYLNGNHVGKVEFACPIPGYPCYSGGNAPSLTINPAWLNPTGDNLLAIRVRNIRYDGGANYVYAGWELDVTCTNNLHSYHSSNHEQQITYYNSTSGSLPPGSGGSWYSESFVPSNWSSPTQVGESVELNGVPIYNTMTGKYIFPLSFSANAQSTNESHTLWFRQTFQLNPVEPPPPTSITVEISASKTTDIASSGGAGYVDLVHTVTMCNTGSATAKPIDLKLGLFPEWKNLTPQGTAGFILGSRGDIPRVNANEAIWVTSEMKENATIEGVSKNVGVFYFPKGFEGDTCVQFSVSARDYSFQPQYEGCQERPSMAVAYWTDDEGEGRKSRDDITVTMDCARTEAPVANPGPGEVPKNTFIQLTSATTNARIFWWYEGGQRREFNPNDAWNPERTSWPKVTEATRIYAYAAHSQNQLPPSDTVYFDYTIKVLRVDQPKAVPTSQQVGEFSEPITVTLSVDTPGARILYTTDGGDPRSGGSLVAGEVEIPVSVTTTIKAVGVKAGYDTSTVLVVTYARKTPGIDSAYYRDADGDGRIETAVVVFESMPSGSPPASVVFYDPFTPGDSVTVTAGRQSGTTVTYSLPRSFAFGTGFTVGAGGPFGYIPGDPEFTNAPFPVSDAVAPVVRSGVYRPAAPAAPGAGDTMIVVFSEAVELVKSGTVFPFKADHEGAPYSFELVLLAGSGTDTLTFSVRDIDGIRYPIDGDSIRLDVGEVHDTKGTVQSVVDNARGPLAVRYPRAAQPVADPYDVDGHEFLGQVVVRLSCPNPADARIFYTTGGSTTPLSAYQPYDPSSGVVISGDATLRAYAVKQYYDTSTVLAATYRRKPSRALHGYYRDTTGDGRIDNAVIVVDTIQDGAPSSTVFTNPFDGTVELIVPAGAVIVHDEKTMELALPGQFSFGTGFGSATLARIPSDPLFGSTPFVMHDSVAPVIEKAEYRAGAMLSGESQAPDTLVVTFSESSVVAPGSLPAPFGVVSDAMEYTLELEALAGLNGRVVAFLVDTVIGVSYPRDGDSIWIRRGAVSDARGNSQDNPNNRRAPLSVSYPPISLSFVSSPNPFIPGHPTADLPEKVVAALSAEGNLPPWARTMRNGTVVAVQPSRALPGQRYSLSGKGMIYDIVGNVVLEQIPMARAADNTLYLPWDGKNLGRRTVGMGTYLAVITVRQSDGRKTVHRQRIGVAR